MTTQAQAFCLDCLPYEKWLYDGSDGRAAYQKAKAHHKKTGHETVWRTVSENTLRRNNTSC